MSFEVTNLWNTVAKKQWLVGGWTISALERLRNWQIVQASELSWWIGAWWLLWWHGDSDSERPVTWCVWLWWLRWSLCWLATWEWMPPSALWFWQCECRPRTWNPPCPNMEASPKEQSSRNVTIRDMMRSRKDDNRLKTQTMSYLKIQAFANKKLHRNQFWSAHLVFWKKYMVNFEYKPLPPLWWVGRMHENRGYYRGS